MAKQPSRRPSTLLVFGVGVALFSILLPIFISGEVRITIDEELPRLAKDRTILVTGANAGLGLATVKLIAQAGTAKKLILACRNTGKCENAQKEVKQQLPENCTTQVLTVHLDLANRNSIIIGARSVQQHLSNGNDGNDSRPPALDVLINNAGIAFAWDSKDFVQGVEMHMAVNHVGHVLLTHHLWENILTSIKDPRIVHVSSITAMASWRGACLGWYDKNPKDDMGRIYNSFDSIRYYSQSKRANLMQTWELHKRYKDLGISSVASHPGYTRSELVRKMRLPLLSEWLKDQILARAMLSMSTEEGAKMQLLAAFAPQEVVPSGSHVVPKYWIFGRPVLIDSLMKRFSTHFLAFSEKDSDDLWHSTLRELGIAEFGKVV